MAWTHVGSASDGTSGSVPSETIDLPVGTAVGDLAVVVTTVNDSSSASASVEVIPNTGVPWTPIGNHPENGVNNSFMSAAAYWKILDANDIAQGFVAINWNGFRSQGVGISVWRADGDISHNVEASFKDTADGDPTPESVAGVTTTAPDCLVFILSAFSQATATYDFEAGYTQRTTGVFGTRNVAIYTAEQASAGATGALDASIRNNFFGYVTFVVAFAEEGTGGTGYTDTVDVSITATLNSTDSAARADIHATTVTATLTPTDLAARVDSHATVATATLNLTDTAQRVGTHASIGTATTPSSDVAVLADAHATTGTVTLQSTDTAQRFDTHLSVATGTVPSSDVAGFVDAQVFTISATVEVSDQLTGATNDYTDTVNLTIAATVEAIDVQTMVEAHATTITATTPGSDAAQRFDSHATVVAGTVTVVDVGVFVDPVTVLSTVLVPTLDQLASLDLHSTLMVVTVATSDQWISGSIPPFVIMVLPVTSPWAVRPLKQGWKSTDLVETISEGP